MDEFFPSSLRLPADVLSGIVGILLLVWGRKLFSVAIAFLGAAVGLHLAQTYVHAPPNVQLIIAVLLGVGGFVLAVAAQKVAVAVGGIALGGMAAIYFGQVLQADMNTGVWLGIILAAAVVGGFLGGMLFDLTVALLTSAIGAVLLVGAAGIAPPIDVFVLVGLVVAGVVLQTSKSRKNRLNR